MHFSATYTPLRFGIMVAAVLLSLAAVVKGHEPYESNAQARLENGWLELTVTTSLEIAGLLAGERGMDAAALESRRPQMLKTGAELYEVSASGKPLQPERTFFALKNGESVFSIIYPLGQQLAELSFRAVYLSKLPQGYAASIQVFDEAGSLMGGQPLLKKGDAKDTFSVRLPAVASNQKSEPAPANAAEPQHPLQST